MGLQFYKPNKGNTGHAAHFSFAAKANGTKAVFIEIVKQNGWNAEGRNGQGNGIFKDGKKIVTKLSTTEVATIIESVNRREDAPQFFHTSPKGSTTINFKQYKGKVKKDNAWVNSDVPTGFAFSVSAGASNDDRYGITLTWGEARELAQYFVFALEHINSAVYAEEKAKAKEYAERKESGSAAPSKTKKVSDFMKDSEPEAEPVSAAAEDDECPF